MTPQEAIIIAIAELIEVKQKLIKKMQDDVKLLKSKQIDEVTVRVLDHYDEHYLFDCAGLAEEILDDSLKLQLEWIVDNVYDRAIGMTQDKIDRRLNELKQDLLKHKEAI